MGPAEPLPRDTPFTICGHCGGPMPAEDAYEHAHEECKDRREEQ